MTPQEINSQSMLRIGTILRGIYRIDSYLSSGGFGNTYVATNIEFDERVAIKEFFIRGVTQRDNNQTTVSVSNSENQDSFLQQREKFKKEARRIRQLNSPHIVKVHDLFEENGTAYYVMDFIDGENLSERLRRTGRPMTEEEVKEILPQILDALQTVHDACMWHLDLKPANIMVDKDEQAKLIDFGASKQLNAQKGGATTSTSISYTNGYAPREQMEQNYDKFGPWTDFYALGATLYKLLTNNQPPMPTDIDDDLKEDKHTALPMANVSEGMKRLILWLMKTNRMERPKTIQEIKEINIEGKPVSVFTSIIRENEEINEEETIIASKKEEQKNTIIQTPTQSLYEEDLATQEIDDNSDNHWWLWIILIACAFIGSFWLLGTCNSESTNATMTEETKVEDNSNFELSDFQSPIGICTYIGPVDEYNRPNGVGEAFFKDGRYYKGPFDGGNLDGSNAYFKYPNGDEFRGTFRENSFSEGVYTVADTQEYFKGTFQNGQPYHGTWYNKNNQVLEVI